MNRVVEPEFLDQLPVDDPGAIGSRRDIHRLNALMGNAKILCDLLQSRKYQMPLRQIAELGGGDGRFMLRFASCWNRAVGEPMTVVLVDLKRAINYETWAELAMMGWMVKVVEADVFDWLRGVEAGEVDVMVANLFLHHFSESELGELLRLAAGRTRLFAACEPWRSRRALFFSRMSGLIGCNAVTRHDAVASVRAGFANRELSELWPRRVGWRLRERSARLFTHAFVAERVNEG